MTRNKPKDLKLTEQENESGYGCQVRPFIFDSIDYRQILLTFYQYKKSLRKGFTYRKFSQLSGFKSPNYLQLVIQGKRNLSNEVAARVAKALTFNATESQYFEALVRKSNAMTRTEIAKSESEMLKALKKAKTKEIPKAKKKIIEEWYHLVIREMIALQAFQPNGDWISERLGGLISPEQAEESIVYLLQAGFLKKIEANKLIMSEPVLDTGNDFSETQEFEDRHCVLNFHIQTLKVWQKVFPKLAPQERLYGLINMPISREKAELVMQKIRDFQDEIIGLVEGDEENAEEIYQFGTYLIPITEET